VAGWNFSHIYQCRFVQEAVSLVENCRLQIVPCVRPGGFRCDIVVINSVRGLLPHLRTLVHFGDPNEPLLVVAALSKCQNLQELNLYCDVAVHIPQRAFLMCLRLITVFMINVVPTGGWSWLAQLPDINSLSLLRCQLTDADCVTIATAVTNSGLTELKLVFDLPVTEAALFPFENAVPNLTDLDLSSDPEQLLYFPKPIWVSFKKLVTLSLGYIVVNTLQLSQTQHLSLILDMKLTCCGLTDDGCKELARLYPKLRLLDVSGNGITEHGVAYLVTSLHKLEALYIDDTAVTSEHLWMLFVSARNLLLSVPDCCKSDGFALHCPNIDLY